MNIRAVLTLLCVGLASPAFAQDAEIDCDNAMAQQDMNQCADKDYQAADADLNTIWTKAKAAAKAVDDDQSDDLKGAVKALLAAQRGWIAYRNGQCELAGFQMRGGSAEPMLVAGCLADLTRKRTKELQDFIGGPDQ